MRIKELLRERGMTAKELASQIGMSETGLSIAMSDNGNPPLNRLKQIAAALDVSVSDLFEPSTDFVAFVRNNGQTYTFDNKENLKDFVDELCGERKMPVHKNIRGKEYYQ